MKEIYIALCVMVISISSYNRGVDYKKDMNLNCPYEFDSLAMMNVFTYVDEMPEYPGGNPAMLKFIAKNFRYPDKSDFQASFRIQFVVDIDGSIIAARVRGRNKNELTLVEKELLKVLCKMPKWKPGACLNKSVPVKINLPLYL
ncbi:hypothetical protein GO495_31440 [Chitinophaga oryziterrae]|uniref:TonB C-terminal domain-containing protein n=1 Tax=Chitinophaga oryziterrae TaxID=1031224 RepID=A0A6N8JJI6_9BACT|nr:hypothetical protein [Chitinophaga oryziterrae]MVT45144.1 hypothetical protein [Chitinophaga oryziterrae]